MGGKTKTNLYLCSYAASAIAFTATLVWSAAAGAAKPEQGRPQLEQQFTGTVKPFLQTYCVSCHGKVKPQAQLDLTAYVSTESVARDYAPWSRVIDKLTAKQMPPPAMKQPSAAQRNAVIAWIRAVRKDEAERNAGDPGPVPARRLSNAEYDYTIRDLTGVDLRPTREFPVDPANQEGFDNSGESLTLSSALVKKYVQAAKGISDHLVLTANGFEFAPYDVLAETDRDKFCILRIVDFYKRRPTDYADYFQAAWRYRHRAALGASADTLHSIAMREKVSQPYLELVWKTLTTPTEKVGPIARLQTMWNALPAPDKSHPEAVRPACEAMRDWVLQLRKKTACKFDNLRVPRGFSTGGQCFVLWKDREYASHRRSLNPDAFQVDGVPKTRTMPGRRNRNNPPADRTVTDPVDPDLFVPLAEAARAPYLASFNQFCSVFPDAFYISERGRMFVDDPGDKGRLLTAGLHNSLGYFRDDTPLMELILDESGRRNLERLWLDFDTIARVPERMHIEFFHYERAESQGIQGPEFNFAKAEDSDNTSDAKIKRLADAYLAKAKRNLEESGGDPASLQAIDYHFKWVSSHIRATERARLAAEPAHLKALVDFAHRAYRRPLTDAERADLLAFYKSLRQNENLNHEDAVRDVVVSILMSPKFLFRLDLEVAVLDPTIKTSDTRHPTPNPPSLAGDTRHPTPNTPPSVQPLSDYALASRLSYFLWSSMPDDELLSLAAAGNLHKPEVLTAQARRMLKDPRARALALEFGGNWLDFRRFEQHNAVDRERFPSFNDSLREAMFEEPLHFLTDELKNDRSVLDLLYGKYTFVNAPLAAHYGMNEVKPRGNEWVRVENAVKYGRGGLLPMAVFMTMNAPGLRTSPVKRGYWVVRRVLGETIPPPPPTVPQLPADESKLGTLTLRDALKEHRSNPACSGCHARFDSYGLVFEGYGPIGELRSKDLGGKLVDAKAPFADGTERLGVAGLQDFVKSKRQQDFLDTLARKLLSYGLGRSVVPSDDSTLAEMQKRLAANGYRFGTLVETIVSSRQFRYRRGTVNADSHKDAKSQRSAGIQKPYPQRRTGIIHRLHRFTQKKGRFYPQMYADVR